MRLLTLSALSAAALSTATLAAPPSAPAPADLAGIDQAIRGTYAVISGPPGQKRDFDRMRALFAPGALLRVITPKGIRGGSLDDYIAKSGTASGSFHERGINSVQLVRVDGKWLVASILWQEETPAFPLPADMEK